MCIRGFNLNSFFGKMCDTFYSYHDYRVKFRSKIKKLIKSSNTTILCIAIIIIVGWVCGIYIYKCANFF